MFASREATEQQIERPQIRWAIFIESRIFNPFHNWPESISSGP
jgi:hypothetical protein